MSMTRKNQRISAVTLLISFALLRCADASANNNASHELMIAEKETIRDQQQTIEAIRDENRRLRAVIEEMQRVLSRLTDTDQVVEIPEVEVNSKVAKDEFDSRSGLLESPAYARDFELSKPSWRFSLTPRTALRFGTFHDFSQSTDGFVVQEEADYWTNGLTLSVTTPWLPETSFLITGLYGQDDGEQVIGGSINSTTSTTFRSDYDSDIYDFEILARTPIAGSNANWLAGIQHMKFNFDYDNPVDFGLGTSSHVTAKYYLAKVGLGGFFNVSDNGFHRLFSNVILGGGFLHVDSDLFENDTIPNVAGDLNIGYEWVINPTFSVSGRYRAQVAYNFGGNDDLSVNESFIVLHGPELHFTTRF